MGATLVTIDATHANPDCDHGVIRRARFMSPQREGWICSNDHFPDCHYSLIKREVSQGAMDIVDERMRQIEKEGYTDDHDLEHPIRSLMDAARAYIQADYQPSSAAYAWPWHPSQFKPGNTIRNLQKAGALIAAAIDRKRDTR